MIKYRLCGLLVCVLFVLCGSASAGDKPVAMTVPKGMVTKYTFEGSKIFPGTTRDYWIYVPAQYDGSKPACVHVNQDGVQFKLPEVMDRLIASNEMPVTIGIFVMHGKVLALSTNALDRFNRSYEYDGLGDNYARFILDELLPHIVTEQKLNLSTNGNDRSIGGSSSGAICAFTAAWERPDAFSRVLSAVGTYVGLRGGNDYPTLIRKTEPKALRVFLQDGSADLNIYCGDWWMVNQEMERALAFAGYEVNHVWGDGGHNGKQMTEIAADAMKWLWKDWPAPISKGQGSQQMKDILLPGEEWQPAGEGYKFAEGPDVAIRADGGKYVTSSGNGDPASNLVWFISATGEKKIVDSGLKFPCGVALSPDQSLLYVCDALSHWVYSYQVQPDGSLKHKQKYYHLHQPDCADDSGAAGMKCDRDGRLYVATRMGVQVCDQAGRVNCILPTPNGRVVNLCFGGENFDTLFATCGDKVFKRKLRTCGLNPAAGPVKPARPHL